MNTLWHFLINIILMKILGFSNFEAFIVGFSSFIIDLDHILRVFFVEKKKSLKEALEWFSSEFKKTNPHFFIFHNIEFNIIFLITAYYLNYYLFLIAIGFFIHYLEDCLTYILKRKPLNWLNYYILTLYLLKKKKLLLDSDKKLYKAK